MLRILLSCPDSGQGQGLRDALEAALVTCLPPTSGNGAARFLIESAGPGDDSACRPDGPAGGLGGQIDLLLSAEEPVAFVRRVNRIRPRPAVAVLAIPTSIDTAPDPTALSAADDLLPWPCLPELLRAHVEQWIRRIRLARRCDQMEDQIERLTRDNSALRRQASRQERLIELRDRHDGNLRQIVARVDGVTRLCQQLMTAAPDGEAEPVKVDQIVRLCIQRVPPLLGVRLASLYLHEPDRQLLRLQRHNHPYPINTIVKLDDRPNSPMALAVRRKELLLINEPGWAQLICQSITRPYAHRYATGNCVIAPLLAGGRVVGVLNLADRADNMPFDELTDLLPIRQLAELLGVSIRNIELYETVQRQAKTDGMTGLANHGSFMRELGREINRSRRYGTALSLIVADVDSLKRINDQLGHVAGDRALMMVARQVVNSIRDSDLAARYGGDEFAVLLPSTALAAARAVADRLLASIAAVPVVHDRRSAPVTVSVGVGQYDGQASAEQFIEQVDAAMYRAKLEGKNRVEENRSNAVKNEE